MKLQPLIGNAVKIYFENRGEYYFSKEDVGAAVNWLKGKIENESRSNIIGSEDIRYPVDYYRIMRLIDEAFADVMPVFKDKGSNEKIVAVGYLKYISSRIGSRWGTGEIIFLSYSVPHILNYIHSSRV